MLRLHLLHFSIRTIDVHRYYIINIWYSRVFLFFYFTWQSYRSHCFFDYQTAHTRDSRGHQKITIKFTYCSAPGLFRFCFTHSKKTMLTFHVVFLLQRPNQLWNTSSSGTCWNPDRTFRWNASRVALRLLLSLGNSTGTTCRCHKCKQQLIFRHVTIHTVQCEISRYYLCFACMINTTHRPLLNFILCFSQILFPYTWQWFY